MKLLLTLLAVLTSMAANAQAAFEGRIRYVETMQLSFDLDDQAASLAASLPKEKKAKRDLWIKEQIACFLQVKEDKVSEEEISGDGVRMRFEIKEPEAVIYTDLESLRQWQMREFMTRTFLIETKLDQQQWKLTGEQREILGYNCLKAVRKVDSTEIIAWFAPALPKNAGPDGLGNLPGTILRAEYQNGERVTEATEVVAMPVAAEKLVKPNQGKKVTLEAFKQIQAEKMKEMADQYGQPNGKGNVIIRIQR
jgi:GLPGLI family protein